MRVPATATNSIWQRRSLAPALAATQRRITQTLGEACHVALARAQMSIPMAIIGNVRAFLLPESYLTPSSHPLLSTKERPSSMGPITADFPFADNGRPSSLRCSTVADRSDDEPKVNTSTSCLVLKHLPCYFAGMQEHPARSVRPALGAAGFAISAQLNSLLGKVRFPGQRGR